MCVCVCICERVNQVTGAKPRSFSLYFNKKYKSTSSSSSSFGYILLFFLFVRVSSLFILYFVSEHLLLFRELSHSCCDLIHSIGSISKTYLYLHNQNGKNGFQFCQHGLGSQPRLVFKCKSHYFYYWILSNHHLELFRTSP